MVPRSPLPTLLIPRHYKIANKVELGRYKLYVCPKDEIKYNKIKLASNLDAK